MRTTSLLSPPGDARFLSREQCTALAKRVAGMAVGGGYTQTVIDSLWTGNVRWARNDITTCGDVRNTEVQLIRDIRGADPVARVSLNQIDDTALRAAVQRAERLLESWPETQASRLDVEYTEQHLTPTIWSDVTYALDGAARADAVRTLLDPVDRAGMVSAGYIEVGARGRAVMSSRGRAMYYPYTVAQCSVTVRDPQGQGSGWAGVSHYDWSQIDAPAIVRRALDKCLRSRNPVALEPGRYTTILEPQAVCDLFRTNFEREPAESPDPAAGGPLNPFWKEPGQSRLGEVVIDPRLTLSSDPADPELGVPPFFWGQRGLEVYHPAQWITNGVLTNLSYMRQYAVARLGKDTGLPWSDSWRLSSNTPAVSMDEMIATTQRGLLVTRLYGEYTRDGLWLIEKGKLSKPVKNFRYDELMYLCLQSSRVEQVGAPERVFHPGYPVFAPALKIKDFNFTQLADAI